MTELDVELLGAEATPAPGALAGRFEQRDRDRASAEASAASSADQPIDGQVAGPIDYTAEARELVDFLYESLTPVYPSFERVYTLERRERLGVAYGKLFKKYDLTFAKLFRQYEPEISVAMVTVPLIKPTRDAMRADDKQAAFEAAAGRSTDRSIDRPAEASAAAPASSSVQQVLAPKPPAPAAVASTGDPGAGDRPANAPPPLAMPAGL